MRISDWSSDVLLFRSAGQAPADRDAWRDCAARSDGAEREHQVDARRRGRTRRRRPADRDDPSLLPPPHARPRPGRARAPGARRRPRPRAKACRLMARTKPWLERSEEHTSELQSLMRTPYAVFGLNKKKH